MEVKLIKKTTKIFGKEYYFVQVDGDSLISDTWTSDKEKGEQNYLIILEGAKTFPKDTEETIKSYTI